MIVHEPETGQRTARPGLDRDPRQPERRPVIACRGLTGAQHQQFHGPTSILAGPDERLQIVQCQLAVIGEDESFSHIPIKLAVRGDVNNRVLFVRQFAPERRQCEALVQKSFAGSRRINAAQFAGNEIQRSESLHRFGKSVQQQARFPAFDGARFNERKPGRDGHGQVLN